MTKAAFDTDQIAGAHHARVRFFLELPAPPALERIADLVSAADEGVAGSGIVGGLWTSTFPSSTTMAAILMRGVSRNATAWKNRP